MKLKNLVRDKKVRDFYVALAKDYAGLPMPTVPALTDISAALAI